MRTSCNYHYSDFFYLILLLMAFGESYLSKKIETVYTNMFFFFSCNNSYPGYLTFWIFENQGAKLERWIGCSLFDRFVDLSYSSSNPIYTAVPHTSRRVWHSQRDLFLVVNFWLLHLCLLGYHACFTYERYRNWKNRRKKRNEKKR